MNITKSHIEFWTAKHLPGFAPTINPPSIHKLINCQIPKHLREPQYLQAHKTLGILRLVRKRGKLLTRLYEMMNNPQTTLNPKRRAAFCRKWLNRILKEKGELF